MSEEAPAYPVVLVRPSPYSGDIDLETIEDESGLSRWSRREMAAFDPDVWEIFDSAGRYWRISGFERLKPIITWWDTSTWFGRGAWRVRPEFKALPPPPLEAVKAKMIEIVDSDPLVWCDEELIAGEAGEPIDEEILIARVHGRIRAVQSLAELPGVMENAYYGFDDAKADGLLKPRPD